MVVPKSEKMQRQAETNKEQTWNHGYLKGNERSDQGFVLYRNREPSWKIPLRSKGSSQYGVATENNGGLWWLMVAVGDGESAWDVRNGFGRKKGEEMAFFLSYTKAKAKTLM